MKGFSRARKCCIAGYILLAPGVLCCAALLVGQAGLMSRWVTRSVDQIFRNHFAFMVSGVLFATGLLLISYECKAIRVLSGILLFLALLYPAVIALLYIGRHRLGEHYLILGELSAALLGLMGGGDFRFLAALLRSNGDGTFMRSSCRLGFS